MRGLRVAMTMALVVLGALPGATGHLAAAGQTRQIARAGDTLAVQHLSPPPGATNVPPGGLLAVQFDRPVAALGAIGVAGREAPVRISPPVNAAGRWVGTSLWALSGPGGLAGATAYTVRIPAGLRAADGSRLPRDVVWSFTTARPGVQSIAPQDGAQYTAPGTRVVITFNQPVDQAAAEGATRITLTTADGSVTPWRAVTWTWRGQALTITPTTPWPLGARVSVQVGTGLRAAGGGALRPLQPFAAGFAVARSLRVASTTPPNGQQGADPSNGVTVNLTAPIDPNTADRAVTITPALDQRWVNAAGDGLSVSIGGSFQPATRYTVLVNTRLRAQFGGALPLPYSFSFTTRAAQPSLSFYNLGPVATFNLYRAPTIYARAVNVSRVNYVLYRPSEAAFARMSAPDFDWAQATPEGMTTVRRWSVAVRGKPNKGVNVGQRLRDPRGVALPAGYYYLTVSNGDQANDHQLLLITGTGLTLKVAQRQTLVWATDLKTGQPIAGMAARVIDSTGRQVAAGRTGADGTWVAEGLRLQGYQSLLDAPLLAVGHRLGDVAAAALSWNTGISPWDYNLSYATRQPAGRMYLYTERPIYRPAQFVYFRGVARTDDDGHYGLFPAGTSVRVRVDDALGHTIYLKYLRLSAAGTFDGQLLLSGAAALGDYYLSATVGPDTYSAQFAVAAYRKPSFALAVTPFLAAGGALAAQSSFVQGDRIAVRARATYYFGAALGGVPVAWSVLSDDYYFSSVAHPEYQFTDFDAWSSPNRSSMGAVVTQGAGTTDATGAAAFSLRADTVGHPVSQQLTIEATIGDAGHETVSERAQVIVHKGGYYVGLHPAAVVATAGAAQQVDLLAVRPDGTTPVAGAAVRVSIYQRTWYSVYMRDPSSGQFQWQTRPHDTLVTAQTARTDLAGAAAVRFTPAKGGEYRVTADAVDSRGNAIHSATYLWAGSEGYTAWGFANNDRLRLVADRALYHTGDVAHVLVPAPLNGMLALVTLERGRVLTHYLRRLKGNSALLDVPITVGATPDVYLSVVLVKGPGKDTTLPAWKMGYIHLPVDQTERSLRVTITPRPSQGTSYSPGQRVEFAVHTADYKGRPVAAQLSLALVDAAVLALAQDANSTILDTFYADRELGVSTASTLALSVDRLNLNENLGSKGGSGGGGGGGTPPTRHVFPDTAYWNPHVSTDAVGNATVSLTLPDSLTTWRMVARGATDDGLVGGGSADLISTKSILINPALPRFLTLGDRAYVGGTVANNASKALRVRVTLVSRELRPANGAGAAFGSQELTVPAGGQVLVTWPARAPLLGSADVELAVEALDGSGRTDRVTTSLPVAENSTAETVATAGSVSAALRSVAETVTLPAAREPGEGDLTISLQPSVGAGLGGAAADLDRYPYSCVEQTTSRAVGEALVAGLPRALTGLDRALAGRVPDVVGASLQRLMGMQHSDGGWGWWLDDTSDPYMSAYAVDGLITLRHLGAAVDAATLSRALDYLHTQLTNPPGDASGASDPNLRAYLAYALARGGRGDVGSTMGLAARPARLSPTGLAYLAMAVAAVTNDTHNGAVLTLRSALENAVHADATGAHWEADPAQWRTLDSSVGATAVALYALLSLDPQSPLIPGAARWLLAVRQGPSWPTTQQTALALRALTYLASSSGELTGSYSYSVVVAGKVVARGGVTPATLARERTVRLPLDSVPAGGAAVRFQLSPGGAVARGRLYYTLRLRYFRAVDRQAPLAQGAAVTRSYAPVRGVTAQGGAPWSAGSTVRVTVHVVAPQDLYYVLLEDPLPAGTEGLDTSLRTTSATVSAAARTGIPQGTDDLTWYLSHSEVRDDRVALFANYLPAGSYQYSYLVHLTTAGTYHALPTHIAQMYFPDVFGRSAGGYVTVGR